MEDYEKKYKEALEKARKLMGYPTTQPFVSDLKDIFPELKESEDERMKNALLEMVHDTTGDSLWVDYNVHKEDALAWLEKQGEHANFRNKIQIGDKVTRNEDGVLVNLSQLNRVAKKDEKQGEQKPAWSEEDESRLDIIFERIERGLIVDKDDIDRLKSLKDRYTWKPSEEQIKALERECMAHSNYDLCRLCEQLKKLREE